MSTEMRPGTRGLEWGSVLQIFALALVIATLSEWMGALPINLGVGKVVLLPMIWALLIGLVLGLLRKRLPATLKLSLHSQHLAAAILSCALFLFIAKLGLLVGGSLPKLAEVGGGLVLQELGNLVGCILMGMPLALLLGIVAGVNEGRAIDRTISIIGLTLTATPEFVTGIFLILIFGIWLKLVPAVAIFTSPNAIFENPSLLILPVLTLTAVELGYVARMTRASMVEVMDTPYIRTAIIKGMPRGRVIFRHAVRNALLAPITIIMLHVNWLIGGLVVVEVIFGYPGLGQYIYDAAIFGDPNAIEAAAMILVIVAVGTRLVGDFAYTLLNPRIRYA